MTLDIARGDTPMTALEIVKGLSEALSGYDATCKKCPVNFPGENRVSRSDRQDKCSRCGNTASGNCGVESSASYALIQSVRTLLKDNNNGNG